MYCKKQKLNELLYKIHLEYAKYLNVTWQYLQTAADAQLGKMMDSICQNLNKKLDALQKQKPTMTITKIQRNTHVKFSNEQINTFWIRLCNRKEPKRIY